MEGWLYRVPLELKLQKELDSVSEVEKSRVYLNHDLLYDALTQMATSRITKPNNNEIETAWSELITTTLGWHDLIEPESATTPSLIDMQISAKSQ